MSLVAFIRSPTDIQIVDLDTLNRESCVWVDGSAVIKGVTYSLVMSVEARSRLSTNNLTIAPVKKWSEDPSYNWNRNKS